MTAPLFAGFEGAQLHWNGHCTLSATRHVPGLGMARHYAEAIALGAQGFRDTLPERFDPLERWLCARAEVPDALIVWSSVHFDQPHDPIGHAQRLASMLRPRDRMIAVNEPSVGHGVAGQSAEQATAMAAAMMAAALSINPDLRFWTCDPVHHCGPEEWTATDHLIRLFNRHIEVIGVNYHAFYAQASLRDVLRCAADRYPDHRIALTETSWHEGHPSSLAPHVGSRVDWWQHIMDEVEASGVPLVCATWAPWLDMAWEPGQVWPNGWPGIAA